MKRILKLALQIGGAVAAVALASAVVLAILLVLIGKWNLTNFILSLQILLSIEGMLIAAAGVFSISGFGWVSPGPPGRPYMRGTIPSEPQKRNPALGVKMIAVGFILFLLGFLWLSVP